MTQGQWSLHLLSTDILILCKAYVDEMISGCFHMSL